MRCVICIECSQGIVGEHSGLTSKKHKKDLVVEMKKRHSEPYCPIALLILNEQDHCFFTVTVTQICLFSSQSQQCSPVLQTPKYMCIIKRIGLFILLCECWRFSTVYHEIMNGNPPAVFRLSACILRKHRAKTIPN